jgi:GrpB-like predicted nucleotidyltransferase (UPF0157 family)
VPQVVLVAPDPAWPERFATERAALLQALGDAALDALHVGSTAIPGILAKPVIDLILLLREVPATPAVQQAMAEMGYLHRGEFGIPGRAYFTKPATPPRTHNVHAYAPGHAEVERHLRFRDHLRRHPDQALRYQELKLRLVALHPDDVEAYAMAKTAFVAEIVAREAAAPGM